MKKNIICYECESEFSIKILEADLEITYCPFCGEELDSDDDDE